MSKYKRGTQAMLDAAKNDATLLPFDTVFKIHSTKVIRCKDRSNNEAETCLFMIDFCDPQYYHCCTVSDLSPAKKDKKPKQKKWKNGSKGQLDAAKDDARLIPKKTYFRAKHGELAGMIVYRIDSIGDDSSDVLMYNFGVDRSQYMTATELEPINEE